MHSYGEIMKYKALIQYSACTYNNTQQYMYHERPVHAHYTFIQDIIIQYFIVNAR